MFAEPINFCIICANTYSSPDFVPITFECGHTFCSTCVNHGNHYKTYNFKEGLCIVDRTMVLQNKQGRVNKALLQYLNQYQKHQKQSQFLMTNLEQTYQKNQKLTNNIEALQQRCLDLEQQKQQLQDELQQIKLKPKVKIDIKPFLQQQQTLIQKLEKLKRINEIKEARRNELNYLIRKLRRQVQQ